MPNGTVTSINTADVLAIDASVARSTGGADFGITKNGFNPKSFGRVLAEKLALARALFGEDIDLTSGSVIRKLLEISALEDARTWAALDTMYANNFISTATGDALSMLGDELGLPRPYQQARGTVKLKLKGNLPAGTQQLDIPRGARMLTSGGHHVATDELASLSKADPEREVAVVAFYPGPEHNLDPSKPSQKIDSWNEYDVLLDDLWNAKEADPNFDVKIEHTAQLTGGGLQWPDTRYRELLLRAPRSIWTADAIRIAVALVPGVRQVQVRDAWGGLDINQSIFGDFNFIERLFSSERDLGSPYYLTILVAPTAAAIWDGPGNLRESVETAIEDLRPISIFPQVQQADVVGVGIKTDLVVRGVPLPTGTSATVNQSQAARMLKHRLLARVRKYVDELDFGEPVRVAEVTTRMMDEYGIADVHELRLLRYPAHFDSVSFGAGGTPQGTEELGCGDNVDLNATEIAEFVDDPFGLTIV